MVGTSTTAQSAIFSPLTVGGRVDAVIDRLYGAITLGLIGEGEQLPRETELASSLGVSTVTLREALSQLRSLGLVKTRRGRGGGSFANLPDGWEPAHRIQRLTELGAYELRDMGDVALAIAGMAARRAAERAADEQIAHLDALVDALAAAKTTPARYRADGRFHVELAAAAHSVRLATLAMTQQADYAELLWIAPVGDDAATQRFHRQTTLSHRSIVEAIRLRDPALARARAEQRAEDGVERLLDLHYLLAED